MCNSFDNTFSKFKEPYQIVYEVKNIKNKEMVKSETAGNWYFRRVYAIAPCIIYCEYGFLSNRIGGLAGQQINFFFFGANKILWFKPYWVIKKG